MNNLEKHITKNEKETRELGYKFAERLAPGAIIALSGDLGCGKKAFVKGVAEYFGSDDDVTSPTFTLVNEYYGDMTVYHFDVYRLENPSLDECDWMDDYFFGDGVCLIEWADNIRNVLPDETLWVNFSKNPDMGDDYREIEIN